ncbi:hypothetical protein BcepF1.058 [Burkholderia phage BcepF1]|uniref:Uncharacterized protein n=1 Tax=Burkholderia phage BcepF1 TaxID=2886897 RepID=A1YZW2_9CAUD|nr:hypothetical protein BcepF1.058 [Burkholderia phage BcepF1]ABL96789.1 hypothetical protein BcepF1.058 [Burkholderia phage BcepF1]
MNRGFLLCEDRITGPWCLCSGLPSPYHYRGLRNRLPVPSRRSLLRFSPSRSASAGVEPSESPHSRRNRSSRGRRAYCRLRR